MVGLEPIEFIAKNQVLSLRIPKTAIRTKHIQLF